MSLHDRDYMRDDAVLRARRRNGFSWFHAVFLLNLAVFVVQYVFDEGWVRDALTGQRLWPEGGVSVDDLRGGRLLPLLTYMFVHGGPWHLIMNMILLWFAGRRVQEIYGGARFLQVYVLSGIFGAAVELALVALREGPASAPLIGASAACFGVLMAFVAARPHEPIVALVYFVIPVRARLRTVALWLLGINFAMGVLALAELTPEWLAGGDGVVAYFAHLGGAVAGWVWARGAQMRQLGVMPPGGALEPAPRRRRPQLARAVRRPVVELDTEALEQQNPRRDPVVDLMKDEVDPILDKITEQGMHSLTDDERRTLERASRQIRRRRS
jgi:membrane associated rhomboid family serine protease